MTPTLKTMPRVLFPLTSALYWLTCFVVVLFHHLFAQHGIKKPTFSILLLFVAHILLILLYLIVFLTIFLVLTWWDRFMLVTSNTQGLSMTYKVWETLRGAVLTFLPLAAESSPFSVSSVCFFSFSSWKQTYSQTYWPTFMNAGRAHDQTRWPNDQVWSQHDSLYGFRQIIRKDGLV